jgi:predicted transcriptional regulator
MTTTTFSVRMYTETKKALETEAKRQVRSAAYIAQRAIQNDLAQKEALHESIREALENDDGTRISGEAVLAWMKCWGDGHDHPFPEADIFPRAKARKKPA